MTGLQELYAAAFAALPELKIPELARLVGDTEDRVTRMVRGKSNLLADDIHRYVGPLQIRPDDLLRALLPDLADSDSTIIESRNWRMRAQALQDELAARRAGAEHDLELVEEITATGRWAVGVLPHRAGPTRDSEIGVATRLAVTPSRPDLIKPGRTVRAAFNEEFGALIKDRAVFLADTIGPLPSPPVAAAAKNVVYLSIPTFTRDRQPRDGAVPLPKLTTNSVAVIALTQSALAPDVTAIAARALGWGLQNASSIGRVGAPVRGLDRDAYVESMNKIRNDGLRRHLLTPLQTTFLHHTGRPTVGDDPEPHALIALINSEFRDQLPFIVLLTESPRMIRRQEGKVRRFDTGEPRFPESTWQEWHDELLDAVETLPPTGRLICGVDLPWAPQSNHDGPPEDLDFRNQAQWYRSAEIAQRIIKTLLSLGAVGVSRIPGNLDPESERVLDALSSIPPAGYVHSQWIDRPTAASR